VTHDETVAHLLSFKVLVTAPLKQRVTVTSIRQKPVPPPKK
jgi:hypothetical protein